MAIIRDSSVWALAFALAMSSAVQAQQPAAQPAMPPAVADPEDQDRYEVGRAVPPVDPGATIVALTLEQAIQRALENNLDLQSARLNPLIQAYSLEAARAAFNPTCSSSCSPWKTRHCSIRYRAWRNRRIWS
jgi:outer membrane protein TolC